MTELTQKILHVFDRMIAAVCGILPKPLQQMIRRWHRLLTYAVMGCINTVVDYVLFSVLYYGFGVSAFWAQTAGMLLGANVGYLLNSSITFSEGRGRTRGQYFQYIGIDSVLALLSGWLMELLETQLSIPVLPVKVLITLAVMLLHYVVYKTLVFRIKKEDDET